MGHTCPGSMCPTCYRRAPPVVWGAIQALTLRSCMLQQQQRSDACSQAVENCCAQKLSNHASSAMACSLRPCGRVHRRICRMHASLSPSQRAGLTSPVIDTASLAAASMPGTISRRSSSGSPVPHLSCSRPPVRWRSHGIGMQHKHSKAMLLGHPEVVRGMTVQLKVFALALENCVCTRGTRVASGPVAGDTACNCPAAA